MNPIVEIDRRRWLRNATVGMLGGGLAWNANGALHAEEAEKDTQERTRILAGECPQVLKVSKHLTGPIYLFPCQPCPCECIVGGTKNKVFRLDYFAILEFETAKPCDETELEPLLWGGVELWLKGTLTLRLDDCPESGESVLVGRNQGRYHIHRYRPNQGVMDGPFCGTEGVLPTETAAKRCCALGHGIGSFCGEGINKLKGWSLCASYHSRIEGLTPDKICEPSALDVDMDLDGVLIGPCIPV